MRYIIQIHVSQNNVHTDICITNTLITASVNNKPDIVPCGRWGQTLTMIDKNRMILYGGQCLNKNEDFENLKKRTWKEPVTNNSDVGRCWHTSNYIHDRHLLITIGGESNGKQMEEVMVLDTEIMLWWRPVMSGTAPSGRSGHSSSYLPNFNSLVVFGGVKKKWLNTISILDVDCWHWSVPSIVGNPPPPRSYHSATVIGKKRIVIFGGNGESTCYNSVHVLDQISDVKFAWSHPNMSGKAPGKLSQP